MSWQVGKVLVQYYEETHAVAVLPRRRRTAFTEFRATSETATM